MHAGPPVGCGPPHPQAPPCEHGGWPHPVKGPGGYALPAAVARLPTPAKAPGPPPSERLENTFRDSEDYIDAGDESELEFLSSRSMPPPRYKARSHRQRKEASCLSCLGVGTTC